MYFCVRARVCVCFIFKRNCTSFEIMPEKAKISVFTEVELLGGMPKMLIQFLICKLGASNIPNIFGYRKNFFFYQKIFVRTFVIFLQEFLKILTIGKKVLEGQRAW